MIDADLVADLRRSFSAALDHDEPVEARASLLAAGWLDALEADEAAAVAVAFRVQGRTGRDAAALDDVIARRLAVGELAVAYPAAPETHVVLPAHRHAARVLWVTELDGERLEIVELDQPLDAQIVAGIDPAAGLLALGARPPGRVTELGGVDAVRAWGPALAAGRVALGHQLVAGAHTMLESASDYARYRTQFGAPIASFQAVKHRLAETLVAISSADAATVAAATTETVTGAMVAKALAGRAASIAGRNCLQVFGGVGFTAEHHFHGCFRRSLVLDRLLGDRYTLERQLGAQLRAGSLGADRAVDLDHRPWIDPLLLT